MILPIRLYNVEKDFNVDIHTVVEFLRGKGFDVKEYRHTKISEEEYAFIEEEFSDKKKSIDIDLVEDDNEFVNKTIIDIFEETEHENNKSLSSVDIEIYKSIQQRKKLTEIYIGSISFPWKYAIADYVADCTEAIPFTSFDKVICGLLSIEDVLSFEKIATILGLNVIDNPNNNQYKDFAEYEILVEALTSLFDFGMIEKGDNFFSSCRLTEIGREYATSGKKFKTTINKEFKLYFDITNNNHEKAKEIFQDIKSDSYLPTMDADYFSEENYLKTFAEKQIPEIYNPDYGNSFTNSYLKKITMCSINLNAGILYDFQLNTFSVIIYNKQIRSDYFTETANSNEDLKTKIIQTYFSALLPSNVLKSELQQQFEEKAFEVQSETDYLLFLNKPQEAVEKINEYHKECDVIEELHFWQNLEPFIENDLTELFFNVPDLCENHNKTIQKLSKARPNLKIFLAFGSSQIDKDKLSKDIFWQDNSPFQKFGCFTKDYFIYDFSYLIPFQDKNYAINNLTKQQVDNQEKVEQWKKKFAQKYIPELLEKIKEDLQNKFDVSSKSIEFVENVDSDLLDFDLLISELGFYDQYKILKQSKNDLLENLKKQHKQVLSEKTEILKNEVDIENIEKLEQINKIKTNITKLENDCLSEYIDILDQLGTIKKELSEKELFIKDQLLAKHYIIDTNVFVDYPEILSKIDNKHNIVLSARVIDELDNLKRKLKGGEKTNVEKALKLINQKLGKKKNNIRTARADFRLLPEDFDKRSPDNQILCVALMYKDKNPFLLTSDNGLQAKAKIFEIPTLSLAEFLNPKENEKFIVKKQYKQIKL